MRTIRCRECGDELDLAEGECAEDCGRESDGGYFGEDPTYVCDLCATERDDGPDAA